MAQRRRNLVLLSRCIYDFALNEPAADKNGFIVYWEPEGNGSFVSGEWTVTAP
jgi:hypothetical protein